MALFLAGYRGVGLSCKSTFARALDTMRQTNSMLTSGCGIVNRVPPDLDPVAFGHHAVGQPYPNAILGFFEYLHVDVDFREFSADCPIATEAAAFLAAPRDSPSECRALYRTTLGRT